MTLYRIVKIGEEDTEPLNYVGVYVLHWRREWGNPTHGFVEAGPCECIDPCCLMHLDEAQCSKLAEEAVYRSGIDNETGTAMCPGCASDALDSGMFHLKEG